MRGVVEVLAWDDLFNNRRGQLDAALDEAVSEAEKAIWLARISELEMIARAVAKKRLTG
jgi:hypothetical protein